MFFNTEHLGVEFKCMSCSVTGVFILLDIKKVKDGINNKKYHQDIRETTACVNRNIGAKKGFGQRK